MVRDVVLASELGRFVHKRARECLQRAETPGRFLWALEEFTRGVWTNFSSPFPPLIDKKFSQRALTHVFFLLVTWCARQGTQVSRQAAAGLSWAGPASPQKEGGGARAPMQLVQKTSLMLHHRSTSYFDESDDQFRSPCGHRVWPCRSQ